MTNDNAAERPWMHFHIAGNPTGGVDARALAELLQEMAKAARLIADEKLSLGRRRGPMNELERSLAAFRVISVSPGSLDITLAEPPVPEAQAIPMWLDDEVTPAAIARDLVREFEAIASNAPTPIGANGRRQAVERVVRSAARIGEVAEIIHYPVNDEAVRIHVVLSRSSSASDEPRPEVRQRIMFGQVFMADEEAGRQRVRVKLADGSDSTMAIERDVTDVMPDVLGQLVSRVRNAL